MVSSIALSTKLPLEISLLTKLQCKKLLPPPPPSSYYLSITTIIITTNNSMLNAVVKHEF